MTGTVVGQLNERLPQRMRTIIIKFVARIGQLVMPLAVSALVVGCASVEDADRSASVPPTIVVTHSVLGSLVAEIVGAQADVDVFIPNGVDPHEWEPSAKDVEAMNGALLVVANGLGLEEGLEGVLSRAESPVFFAGAHVEVLESGDQHDTEHQHDVEDPHFWTDPITMIDVVEALRDELAGLGIDVAASAATVIGDLESLDADVASLLSEIPDTKRVLVTGHVSMTYFAARYGFEALGSIVPSLSTAAEASAANLAGLKRVIADEEVSVIFSEVGSPDDVVMALAAEAGVRVAILDTLTVPGGTYRSYLWALASQVRDALTA